MEEKYDLWRGGSWEQPAPSYPAPPRVTVPPPRPKPSRKRNKRRPFPWRGMLILAITAGILTGALMGANHLFRTYFPPPADRGQEERVPNLPEKTSTQPPSIPRGQTGTGVTMELLGPDGEALDYQEIYRQVSPSVVSIEASDSTGYSTGTGIVLTADGYILTNAHVVAGAEEVRVVFRDNNWSEPTLIGFDAVEDIAVLKVEDRSLTPARFGDSDLLQVGEPVAALGDPLGYRATMTDGIISALNRGVEVDHGVTMTLIQTSTAINFGNSGGALINRYGQVVGVTTIKVVTEDGSSEALGFAIPTQRVKYVVDRLIAGEAVTRAAFGITVDRRQAREGGLTVIELTPGCDAETQGVRPGDILLRADGLEIHSVEDLSQVKLRRGVGDPVVLTILRDGEQLELTIRLIQGP